VAEIHFPVGTLGLGDGFNWWAIAGHSAIRGIVVSQFLEIIRYIAQSLGAISPPWRSGSRSSSTGAAQMGPLNSGPSNRGLG
jgi:hypothetical protein